MEVEFGVLGPVAAWDGEGGPVALKGPRHRAVLARLLLAHRRVVPVERLVDDLWDDPPPGAVGAVRTFVAALRRALEPGRAPRTPARLLVTEGPGYALRTGEDTVDAWCFEREVSGADALTAQVRLERLRRALSRWRGPAYADFADEPWTRAERSRLAELRLHAVEQCGRSLIDLGRPAEAVADLDAHAAEHPWREDAWHLLALALYRSGRQGDALAVLRRARTLLVEQLGVDPGPRLRRLEQDVLHHADHLSPDAAPGDAAEHVWARASAAFDRTVAAGSRARLESTVGLLRELAVTGAGGLEEARRQRTAAIAAAEETGDPELTARVIGAYDVPAIWTRSDDPAQAARVVAAAERALDHLPPHRHEAVRARLLATIALESRGGGTVRARRAAREAERIARRLGDATLLAFTLNGVFMQSFDRAGRAPERDAIGAELVELAARHGLPGFEVLGRLVRLQARSALDDPAGAEAHAAEVDRLAVRHERPLASVFTRWYGAMRLAGDDRVPYDAAEAAYREAAAHLGETGMPGLAEGLPHLALVCLRERRGLPAPTDETADPGPYAPWTRPLVLSARDQRERAAEALRRVPDPPADLLQEALWCLTARAALLLGDRGTMRRAREALAPASAEVAGAGSGVLTLGPVAGYLDALDAALTRLP
ncbi:BTAD domain-containing putative transcriptional regulator [Nocardiopsis sp. Huas11]|uniref:BTAD domain-containing putative transcriptional regulator n=1 Tax=Nocardiopsis sp. Huas11 TaxID=2183912 RepID=UPI000EABECE0|nr:BTAD domain-containing putative transcriptional regulator [Nocardiopsis sp. Huas11]